MGCETSETSGQRRWYHAIGPGLITACVVIGPGSILTSSKVGAVNGYGLTWVVLVAVVFMMTYMMLGARLGVVASKSPGDLVTESAGRWLAVLIGAGVFFISAAFQFGNNLGVDSAVRVYFPNFEYTIFIFNGLALAFLFGFRNLYKALERLMMFFVGLMLVSFAVNLGFALYASKASYVAEAVVPSGSALSLEVLGLVGTTFVISAAYFQCYLVKQKGWGVSELKSGLRDARVGAVLMALITLMIMCTAATVLRGQELNSVKDVAAQLKPLFGEWGQGLFCLGLFSAAYSSFLVNSMIGGFILSDGLGLGSKPTDLWPKLLTALVLLTGMGVAFYVIQSGQKPVGAIVAAQAMTVVASPLMAGALLWLTNSRKVMGDQRNGPLINGIAGIGFLLLLAMAWYTAAYKVWPAVEKALSEAA